MDASVSDLWGHATQPKKVTRTIYQPKQSAFPLVHIFFYTLIYIFISICNESIFFSLEMQRWTLLTIHTKIFLITSGLAKRTAPTVLSQFLPSVSRRPNCNSVLSQRNQEGRKEYWVCLVFLFPLVSFNDHWYLRSSRRRILNYRHWVFHQQLCSLEKEEAIVKNKTEY